MDPVQTQPPSLSPESKSIMETLMKMIKENQEVIMNKIDECSKEIDSMRTKRENKIKKGLIKRYDEKAQEQVDPDPEDLGENKDTSVTYETALIEHKEIETFEKEICPEKYEIREENSFEEKMDDHQEEYIPENNTDICIVETQEEENKK